MEGINALHCLESGWSVPLSRESGLDRPFLDRGHQQKVADVRLSLKVAQIAWDRRSKYLATAGSPQITVWDYSGTGTAGRVPQTLKHHRFPLRAMRYQSDGPLLASGCAEGRFAVWRHETPE
jgi:hypothetical protein